MATRAGDLNKKTKQNWPGNQAGRVISCHDGLQDNGGNERGTSEQMTGSLRCVVLTALTLVALPAVAQVQVRDADTIVVSGTPIRLNGVDAPELGTSAGRDARRWMVNHLRGRQVDCELNGERTHDRWVGVCYVDGEDIGAALVAAGHALDCRRYSGGRYAHLETPAARSRIRRARYC